MSKKSHGGKPKQMASSLSGEVGQLKRLLAIGNYFLARRLAKSIAASDASDSDRAYADYALKKTKPDTQALLAGLACLSATVIVAFIAAY